MGSKRRELNESYKIELQLRYDMMSIARFRVTQPSLNSWNGLSSPPSTVKLFLRFLRPHPTDERRLVFLLLRLRAGDSRPPAASRSLAPTTGRETRAWAAQRTSGLTWGLDLERGEARGGPQ